MDSTDKILAKARAMGLHLDHAPKESAVAAMAEPLEILGDEQWKVVEIVCKWAMEVLRSARQNLPGGQ